MKKKGKILLTCLLLVFLLAVAALASFPRKGALIVQNILGMNEFYINGLRVSRPHNWLLLGYVSGPSLQYWLYGFFPIERKGNASGETYHFEMYGNLDNEIAFVHNKDGVDCAPPSDSSAESDGRTYSDVILSGNSGYLVEFNSVDKNGFLRDLCG